MSQSCESQYPTILDLFSERAANAATQVAYRFLKGDQVRSLTYAELYRQSGAIAHWLQAQVPMGSRVLLVYPYEAGLEFIAVFLGCLLAGMVAVSGHPPRNQSGWTEVADRLKDAEATVLLSTQSLLPKLSAQLNPPFACATDRLSPAYWTPLAISPEQLAFLQYTSGSTEQPKGVMITHQNLMQNQQILQQAFGHTAASVGVGWLPLFHDMGLIGNVLQALYLGASCVLMSPIEFVQQPFRWLKAISDYRATTSGAPNFAYDLLCRKLTDAQLAQLDLSCWEVAFTGAEPVRLETLERFSQKFATCGFRREAFYPCYGMAEATLFITGGQKLNWPKVLQVEEVALEQNRVVVSRDPDCPSRTLVSCGQGWLDTEIAIVDPDSGQPILSDQVGEIWVAGSGLGQGYWQRPAETEQNFRARLADSPERQYLRTGDLGFLQDNELFITGRLHDVLVFWGFNHYPQRIEQTVEACHPGFRANSGAAIAVNVNGVERLVVLQEVERQYRDLSATELSELLRWRVFEAHFLDLFKIVLLKPGGLPKTSSGKVRRSTCRDQLLAGQLDILDQWELPADSPNDPNAVMERYLNPTTHLKRYTNLAQSSLRHWLTALKQ